MSNTFKVEVEREGKWWMIHVPEIDQLTQTRRLSDVGEMARSLIAISTDLPIDRITVDIVTIRLKTPGVAELVDKARSIKQRRNHLAHLEADVLSESTEFAHYLRTEEVPVRDIAELLGVTPQRVSQLLKA